MFSDTSTANKMLKGEAVQIRLDHLLKLCTLLNCTPKELLKLHPEPNLETYENKPLSDWLYVPDVPLASELITLTPAELQRMKQFLREMKGKDIEK